MTMTRAITLLKKIASTRYIFLLSGFAFLLWSLATSLVPKPSTLFTLLQMDLDQSTIKTVPTTQHLINATNTGSSDSSMSNDPNSRVHLGLGVPHAHIYVVSLVDRQDRREQMEFLRMTQDLTWTILDATPSNTTIVHRILDWVTFYRSERLKTGTLDFCWPREINALADSRGPLNQTGSDTWENTSPPSKSDSGKLGPLAYSTVLACATEDNRIPTFANDTPEWMILSPAKVACWHSHVSAIRRFVERQGPHDHQSDDVAIILEDDIDMEKDISTRLPQVWSFLPAGWDIVFLGHCWSDESHYPSLTQFTDTNIHPSHFPKCTHAYALSRSGARRLLQHLRYLHFAYSRALDQAYAWLIRSGRLRGYSIIPSLIVQRKIGSSDILPGSGSGWKDGLQHGVFQAST